MDEEVSAIDHELRRLFEDACGVTAAMRKLGAPGTRPQASELNKSVNGTCKLMRTHLQTLEQLAEERQTVDASMQVEQLVKEHKLQYEKLKSEQESALAEMKKNGELVWRKQRQELLCGGASRTQIKDRRTAVAATEGITESLRRTRQLMSEQIGATDANTQLIGSSTTALGKTREELQSQKRLFTSSRRLLSTMSWYDVLDKFVLYGGVGFFLIVVVYILQKRMLGLTPEFVKSSIHGFMSTSFDKAKDYYQHYVQPPVVPENSIKPPSFDIDELGGAEAGDLIKAVREISEGQHRPHSSEHDLDARKEEESEEISFPDDRGGGHLADHESSLDTGGRQVSEEERDHQKDHAAEMEIEQGPTEGIADSMKKQETVPEVSNTATEKPELSVNEDEPRLVVPTREETVESQRGDANEEDVDENEKAEEDEYLDVELEDPMDNKDEL